MKPQLVIIAGPNGAGKSTLAPTLLRDRFGVVEYVNADPIAEGLSAFRPETVAFAAGRTMLKRLHDLASRRQSFAFETTLATRSYIPWIKDLQRKGYRFHLMFLWLPSADLAEERVRERVRAGGHDVSEAVIRRRYKRGMQNFFDLYRPLANTWAFYDNGHKKPVLVAFGQKKEKETIFKYRLWQIVQRRED